MLLLALNAICVFPGMSSIRRVDMFKLVMVFDGTDPRLKRALDAWAEIAPGLGFDPGQFRAKLIWQKDEVARSHIVVRLRGPRKLILKQVSKTPPGEDLRAGVEAQRDAHVRLKAFKNAHAPEILFASNAGDTVLMDEATGKTLNDHLSAGRNHGQLLKRTGAWLSAFHESAVIEERTYQPRFMVAHAERMADGVESGQIQVADPQRFITYCRAVANIAADAIGQKTISARKHGDFNLRNILLGPDGATGLDFKPQSNAPVGFDIIRVLMDYAELFQPVNGLKPGMLLSDATLDAFFDGYRLITRDDPAVKFLPLVQLLNDWRLIPSVSDKRSWRQIARYKAITALAQTGFNVA